MAAKGTGNAKDLNHLKKFLKKKKKKKKEKRDDGNESIKWSATGLPPDKCGIFFIRPTRVAACQVKPCP